MHFATPFCAQVTDAITRRQAVHTVPITFLDRSAFIKVTGNEGQRQLNISFGFRTYEPDGLLAYHKFLTRGYVKVGLPAGAESVQCRLEGFRLVISVIPSY